MFNSLSLMALGVPSLALAASVPIQPRSLPLDGFIPSYYDTEFEERTPPPGSSQGDGLCDSKYLGCFADSVSARALSSAFGSHSLMTGEMCIGFCAGLGFEVAGTEWSTECFCGMYTKILVARPEGECNMPCGGNITQACGGSVRLSVYSIPDPDPITNPGNSNTFEYVGCWSDSVSDRTLPVEVRVWNYPEMPTIRTCAETCKSLGYEFAGVEYAQECWCGNNLTKATMQSGSPDATGCNMPCRGNRSEFCGGPNRLNVYSFPPVAGALPSSSSSISSTGSATVIATTTASSILTMSSALSTPIPVPTLTFLTFPDFSTTPAASSTIVSDATVSVGTQSPSEASGSSKTPKASLNTENVTSSVPYPVSNVSSRPTTFHPTAPPSWTDVESLMIHGTYTPLWANSSVSSTSITLQSVSGTGVMMSFTTDYQSNAPSNAPPSPTASVSSSSTPLPRASTTPRNVIINGGFENYSAISENWSITLDPENTNDGQLFRKISDNPKPYAHEGSQAFAFGDEGSDSGIRSKCISQTAFHPGGGDYDISAYIGRVPFGSTDLDVATHNSTGMLFYEIYVDSSRIVGDDVCNPTLGECDVECVDGVPRYSLVQSTVYLPEEGVGNHTLSICITYVGQTEKPDYFIIDDVSSFGPY